MLSAAAKRALEEKMRAYVGRASAPPSRARDPVNEPMIRQWCDAMGDANPLYKEGAHGEPKAPPLMLQAWTLEGWAMHEGYDAPRTEEQRLHKLLSDAGYTGVLGTDTEQHFARYLQPGDVVTSRTVIAEISEEKATGVGVGYFITTRTQFSDEHGEEVGWMNFRVLKFIPKEAPRAASTETEAATPAKPARIKPPLAHDNAWWWNNIAEGALTLQRCGECARLRHPPRPMCPHCRALTWDFIPCSGRARLHSWTVIHHPKFPGYEFPLVAALVDLEEGERMVSNVVGCETSALRVGLELEAFIHEDDDGFKLPLFRRAKKRGA